MTLSVQNVSTALSVDNINTLNFYNRMFKARDLYSII